MAKSCQAWVMGKGEVHITGEKSQQPRGKCLNTLGLAKGFMIGTKMAIKH